MLKIIEEEFRGPPINVRNCIYQAVVFGRSCVNRLQPLGYNEWLFSFAGGFGVAPRSVFVSLGRLVSSRQISLHSPRLG